MNHILLSTLKLEGLEHLYPVFLQQEVTDSILPRLSDFDLRKLGVEKIGKRKRLMQVFAARKKEIEAEVGRTTAAERAYKIIAHTEELNVAARRADKDRKAAAERAQKDRKAAAEKDEKERLNKAEAEMCHESLISTGRVTLDGGGRILYLISDGGFQMDSESKGGNGAIVDSLNVSPFFMGETEVTYGDWKIVAEWAKENGYCFLYLAGKGVSDKHPVTNVNWYDAVKWCNAKSEREGLSPCYGFTTGIYRKGEENLVSCNWKANGYRLPTEMEWEKAARGGLVGKKFPNGDTLQKSDANFGGNGTVEVGKYPANGYGLRDMAGNVWEWCWDWYDVSKGLDFGEGRVVRGGSWFSLAERCAVAHRRCLEPHCRDGSYGFRLVRRAGF